MTTRRVKDPASVCTKGSAVAVVLAATLAGGSFQYAWASGQEQAGPSSGPKADADAEAVADAEAETPELYTGEQAQAGKEQYADHCAACHGHNLEGKVGPTLKGPNFARKTSGYTIGSTFSYVANQMPGGNPGSLEEDQYVQIMSYILEENGYLAGEEELTYDGALRSDAALISKSEAAEKGGRFKNIGGF